MSIIATQYPSSRGPSPRQLVRTGNPGTSEQRDLELGAVRTESPGIERQPRVTTCCSGQPAQPLKEDQTPFNRAAKFLWQPNTQHTAVSRGLDLGTRDEGIWRNLHNYDDYVSPLLADPVTVCCSVGQRA